MKVLVTGGAGYIGSHTTLALLNAGYELVALDNCSNSTTESLIRVQKLTGKKLTFIKGDITKSTFLQNLFDQQKNITAVVHFAALKAVGESTHLPLKYYQNNVTGSINLLQAMQNAGVNQLVFSSSCTVYGEPSRVPLDESHPVGSVSSPYGRTKFQVEEIIKDYASANSTFKAAVLRYFNPVGAHPSGEIGEDPLGIPGNLVPILCQVAIKQREKLRIFGSDYPTRDGTAIRDYLHVVDLADAHVKAIEALNHRESGFICNLGTGKGSSVLEVIAAFQKATGKRIPYEMVARRPGDVTEAWTNPALAEKLLGWKTTKSLEEMLADAWRWQSKYPYGYS